MIFSYLPKTFFVHKNTSTAREFQSPLENLSSYCAILFRISSRHENEKQPDDYLRKEYVERLQKGPVNYRLQIQIHEASPDDTATIFHAGILWDEGTHPWFDLAKVSIKTPLSPDAVER